MPFQVRWLIEDKVMVFEMTGDVTLDELRQSAQHTVDTLQHFTHPIHQIIDQTHMESMESNLTEVNRSTRAAANHPMLHSVIVCGVVHPLPRFVVYVMGKLSRSSSYITETYDDALQLLAQLDPAIADELRQLSE